jgi:hypothetical protein
MSTTVDRAPRAPTPLPFPGLTPGPSGHFRLHFYAAVHRVLRYLAAVPPRADGGLDGGLDGWTDRYPFLDGYLAELDEAMPVPGLGREAAKWWEDAVGRWERAMPFHLPIRSADSGMGLTWRGRLAILLVGLPEEDSRFATLFGELQSPLPQRRPCLELVGRILAEEGAGIDPWALCRPLLDHGLMEPQNPASPRAEWALRVPDLLWDVIRGDTGAVADRRLVLHPAASFPAPDELVFPEAFVRRVAHVPALVRDGKTDALLVRGTRGSERVAVAGAIAGALGRRGVLTIDPESMAAHPRAIGPLCVMLDAMPVVEYDLGPGETAEIPGLPRAVGPVACLLGLEGGLRGPRAERAVTLRLPALERPERLRLWERGFDGHPVAELDAITDRFHLPGAYIGEVAAKAVANAALADRPAVALRDVREACRLLNRQLLDTLAEHLDMERLAETRAGEGDWEPLVVNDPAQARLNELQRRCEHREHLLAHLGSAFDGNTNRGVRALFTGPSGTGKTLAAKLVAARLGTDLYRVDLASVINKYIGETEKNLHRVLTTAEELDVILLLDEGDALLGSRTDVKSSNDRYANLETNYLLQRLEHYQGVVIVTTNLGENIDRGFQRRMDIVVDFLPPDAEERLRIWQVHLPERHAIHDAFLRSVSRRCRMTGGQIRNAAQLATLLAIDDRRIPDDRHLEQAVRSEYRKAGATSPIQLHGAAPEQAVRLQAFLDAFSA